MRVTLPAASPKGEQASSFLRLGGAALPVAGSPMRRRPRAQAKPCSTSRSPTAQGVPRTNKARKRPRPSRRPLHRRHRPPRASRGRCHPRRAFFRAPGTCRVRTSAHPPAATPLHRRAPGSPPPARPTSWRSLSSRQTALRGAAISPAVQVTVEDGLGNPVTTDNTTQVTLSLASNPGGSTLSGTLTQHRRPGVATFNNLSLNNRRQPATPSRDQHPGHQHHHQHPLQR